MARVSAPPKARSLSSTTSSQPMKSARFRTSAACGGPMVTAVTLPPCSSLRRRPASMAFLSTGFMMLSTPSRRRLPCSSSRTLSVSGICFIKTMMFILPSSPLI